MSSERAAGSVPSVVVTLVYSFFLSAGAVRGLLQPAASLHGRTNIEKLVRSLIAACLQMHILVRAFCTQLFALRKELSGFVTRPAFRAGAFCNALPQPGNESPS